ncbi:hypothetical protein RJ640_005913 [Escallonia rubra]|uniref:Bystin n=1 Tax=Escallonia rubra TaxID=112253 RepID=A0AA88QVY9_9ASTE|nr:hypothetical protein RJ640_005913 [Escallonia rubra]
MAKKRTRYHNSDDTTPALHKRAKEHRRENKAVSKILKESLVQQEEICREIDSQNPSHLIFAQESPNTGKVDVDDFGNAFGGYQVNLEEVDEEDEKLLEAFFSRDARPQRTLADVILERIMEADARVSSEPLPELDDSIMELYKSVGRHLNKYTSGRMPKAFKYIPSQQLWEEILYLTEPEKWSPHAMFQATRIFASNFGVEKAERFYKLILLPRVREDIRKDKRLHCALIGALKKSLYKPAAFFKGILFPLCESRNCSLREAVIIGGIIHKVSIPAKHSSAALVKLADMEYCGTTSYFIKKLIEKNYYLPYGALNAMVAHFMKFLEESRIMPVIWHQSLLAFVQL